MQIGLGIGATFRRKWVPPLTEQIRSLLFGSGEQGGVYLFDKAHQGGLFQDAAFTTPVTAVEQYVGSFLDWSGNGNHCAQATSTARAKWSARVNLLDKSEDFADAWWSKVRCTIALTGLSSPYNSPVHKLIANSENSTHAVQSKSETIASSQRTAYVLAKAAEKSWIIIGVGSDIPGLAYFDVLNGVKGNVTGGFTSQIVGLDDGWYLCSISGTIATSSDPAYSVYVTSGNGVAGYIGNNSDGVYIASADFRLAANSHLPYQRVNTATDYDTAGFPHYLSFDGADDYYTSIGNIDFTGTDKLTLVAGYTKGDAGTLMQPLAEFLGYSSAGSFGLYTNPSGQLAQIQLSSSGGNLYAAGYPPELAYVITAQTDLAAPFMRIRRDGVLAHHILIAPTGTPYGNAALRIGRRFTGSGFLKGPVHGLIVRGAASSDAELSFAERYLANLQGRAL